MKIIVTLLLISCILSSCSPKVSNKITQIQTQIATIKETVAPVPTTISPSGLPDQHLIKTAFIPQAPEKNWAEPWQDACEEAALLTVDYYYKNQTPSTSQILDSYQNLFNYEKSQDWTSDINTAQMAQVGSDYLGYTSKIIGQPSLDEIKTYLSQNIPIIVPAAGKILFQENKYFKNSGPYYHNLVILGYNDRDKKFTVHDVGTQFGANFKYSYSLLLKSIHDFPQSGKKEDILQGEQNVLVLVK